MKVGDVMTRDVITVRPKSLLSELGGVLQDNRISGLPVVENGRLVGLISLEDFINWLADRQDDGPIEQRMTEELELLNDDDPLVLAIGRFEETGLGRFPVVDRRTQQLVGIVTKGDVIAGLLRKLEIDYHETQVRPHRASHIFEDIEADQTTLLFQYEVKGQDIQQAGTGSSRLKRTLKRLGVRPDVVRRVAIACYEAEMNLVIYTQRGRIRAKVRPESVFLKVEDFGPGIEDVQKALQPGYSTASEWVRELGFGAGMGLTNIQKSADEFDIQSEPGRGTILKMTFNAGEGNGEAG